MNAMLSSMRRHHITRLGLCLLVVALIVGTTDCVGEASRTVKYDLTIASGVGGSVTVPGEGTFACDAGRVVDLVATPASGHRFLKWTGSVATIANPNAASTTITVNGDYSITANFEETEPTFYTLTVGVTGSGSTSPTAGQHTYAASAVVSLIATAATGYRFVSWSDDVGGVANVNAASTTITMNGNYSITANFEETVATYYTLTMVANPVAGGTTAPTGTNPYTADTVVNIQAVAAAGYRFANWTAVPGVTFGNATVAATNFTMPSNNVVVTANFAAGDGVIFPDPKLEAAIRQAIGKSTGRIYRSDLEGLTWLSATYQGITDLTGLQHCINLTWLDLRHNKISNISPLAGLTKLTSLDLSYNEITVISNLANLTSLQYLYLHNNQISVISPLANLTNLLHLYLHSNQISDIEHLASLTKLTRLLLFSNQTSDIKPLANLTNLQWLYLNDNQVSDLSHLVSLTKLIRLELSDNNISDISYLAGLTNLTWLYLRNNQVTDIEALVQNEGLGTGDEVYLDGNPLSQYSHNVSIPALVARGVIVSY